MSLQWFKQSLSRKLLAGLAAILAVSLLILLIGFISLYKVQLEKERADASMQVNFLLQTSLENAMLKRDLSGLAEIVERLGEQKSVRSVMITNPELVVRFSSDQSLLESFLSTGDITGCADCAKIDTIPKSMAWFMTGAAGQEVLRSVNPISNKEQCAGCHGSIEDNPINGILLVDYEAAGIQRKALFGAATLAASSGLVVLLALIAAWLFIKATVVSPVNALSIASGRLSEGRLDTRVGSQGEDELAQLGSSFNIMAQKLEQTLAELKTHEEFLQSMINAAPDGIRVIDENYRILLANKAYCHHFDVDMTNIEGTFCYASSHGRDEPCPPSLITCPMYEFERDETPLKMVHRYRRKDGAELPVEIYAAPLKINRGGKERTYVVEVIRDLEKQMKTTQEQHMAELGQLATGVAHEIHNPLASVRLGLQALLRVSETGKTDSKVMDYLRQVDDEVDKCIDVTRRMLNLSMPPSEHVQLVSLKQAIPEVTSLLKYEADNRGVDLQVEIEGEPRVLATESEIRMLVLNLVQNAFHSMPEGGRLIIRGCSKDDKTILEFEDSGVGISPDIREHIFAPFFSRRADQNEGTGLGLTICKAIIERYYGNISVASEPGKGTTFTVTLPLADYSKEKVILG